jgi:hypothetical protein
MPFGAVGVNFRRMGATAVFGTRAERSLCRLATDSFRREALDDAPTRSEGCRIPE